MKLALIPIANPQPYCKLTSNNSHFGLLRLGADGHRRRARLGGRVISSDQKNPTGQIRVVATDLVDLSQFLQHRQLPSSFA